MRNNDQLQAERIGAVDRIVIGNVVERLGEALRRAVVAVIETRDIRLFLQVGHGQRLRCGLRRSGNEATGGPDKKASSRG